MIEKLSKLVSDMKLQIQEAQRTHRINAEQTNQKTLYLGISHSKQKIKDTGKILKEARVTSTGAELRTTSDFTKAMQAKRVE